MKSRSVSITGVTGFVGWHAAESFAREGWHVRGIVRPGNRKPVPAAVDVVESALDAASLTDAVRGTDVVVHGAAVVRARDEGTFRRVNVEGTVAAAAAAAACGARLVFISSLAAGGEGTPETPRREDDAPAPVNAYGRSKLAAEVELRATSGLAWSIVRPCAVYGPRDRGFLPLYAMGRRGFFFVPSNPSTSFTLIHVADLVRAVVLAAEAPAAIGQTMFVGHPTPHTGDDLLRTIARASGRRFRPFRVPAPVFGAIAHVGDLLWKAGIQPPVDSGRLVELRARGFVCHVDRARERLGFEAAIPLDDGVRETMAWYREQGWV